jgi:hypothetical protein
VSDSTLTVSDYQFLRAFRELFTADVLKAAVAKGGCVTRERMLPLWLLLGLLVAGFWMPAEKLSWLIRWVRPSHKKRPSDSAVYQARGRLGWASVRALRKDVVRVLAGPESDPTAFYRGRRLMGIDGTTFSCADTPGNARCFGRAKNQHGASGYPLIGWFAVGTLGGALGDGACGPSGGCGTGGVVVCGGVAGLEATAGGRVGRSVGLVACGVGGTESPTPAQTPQTSMPACPQNHPQPLAR